MIDSTGLRLGVSVLAAWQIVETLRHGSIFLPLRQWGNRHLDCSWQPCRFAAKLAVCAFCQSHWAPAFPLLAMFYGPAWTQFLAVSLAVTRAAQLLNDLTHGDSRAPPSDEAVEIDESLPVE